VSTITSQHRKMFKKQYNSTHYEHNSKVRSSLRKIINESRLVWCRFYESKLQFYLLYRITHFTLNCPDYFTFYTPVLIKIDHVTKVSLNTMNPIRLKKGAHYDPVTRVSFFEIEISDHQHRCSLWFAECDPIAVTEVSLNTHSSF